MRARTVQPATNLRFVFLLHFAVSERTRPRGEICYGAREVLHGREAVRN